MKKFLIITALALTSTQAVADECEPYGFFAYQVMKGRIEGVPRESFEIVIRHTTTEGTFDNILRKTTVDAGYSPDNDLPYTEDNPGTAGAIFAQAVLNYCRENLAKFDR